MAGGFEERMDEDLKVAVDNEFSNCAEFNDELRTREAHEFLYHMVQLTPEQVVGLARPQKCCSL